MAFSSWRRSLHRIWEQMRPIDRQAWACDGFHGLDQLPAAIRAEVCDSYPPNHNFKVVGDQLIPSRKLTTRVAQFRRYYSQPLKSLLDLSCSKGFFVFDAAREPTCERAVGIDLCDKTLDICRELSRRFVHPQRVQIAKMTLTEMADRIDEFGGPFENVLLVNTYQYLYFGSSIAPALTSDHFEIFRQIRRLCSGRVIFHNRITFGRVQKHIRKDAEGTNRERVYNPAAIRAAASEFFNVTETPEWEGHPVWLLDVP